MKNNINTKTKTNDGIELPQLAHPSISVSVGTLFDSYQAFSKLAAFSFSMRVMNRRMARFFEQVSRITQSFEEDRNALLKEFGETKNGVHFSFSDKDKAREFDQQVEALRAEIVTITGAKLTDVETEEAPLSGSDLKTLDWLIEAPVEDSAE